MSAAGLWSKVFALRFMLGAAKVRLWQRLLLLGCLAGISPFCAAEPAQVTSPDGPQAELSQAQSRNGNTDSRLTEQSATTDDSDTTSLKGVGTPMALSPHRQVGSSDSYPKVIASLLMVVGLILLLAWLTKRFKLPIAGQGPLQVIASLPLSAKERLLVVQVGQQQLLLSSGQQGTRLLTTLEAPLPAANSAAFATVLAKFNNKSSKEVSPGE
ncbi:MAG: flagellar biosynthetic protein FliO [Ferrimonas sp.]